MGNDNNRREEVNSIWPDAYMGEWARKMFPHGPVKDTALWSLCCSMLLFHGKLTTDARSPVWARGLYDAMAVHRPLEPWPNAGTGPQIGESVQEHDAKADIRSQNAAKENLFSLKSTKLLLDLDELGVKPGQEQQAHDLAVEVIRAFVKSGGTRPFIAEQTELAELAEAAELAEIEVSMAGLAENIFRTLNDECDCEGCKARRRREAKGKH